MKELDLHRVKKSKPIFQKTYVAPKVYDLPVYTREIPEVLKEQPKEPKRVLRYTVGFLAILLISGAAFFGNKFIQFANSISTTKKSVYTTIKDSITGSSGYISEAIRGKKTVNILLMGYGGADHDGSYLTDTIMVMSINFANNKTTMISIPRDLWVKLPITKQGYYSKINAAYALGMDNVNYPNKVSEYSGRQGAGNLSKEAVSEILGIQIDHYAAIDFEAFKEIVDALGGVTINVDNAFTDYRYPTNNPDGSYCVAEREDLEEVCRYKLLHFDAGEQYMDGERALDYVRSRHAGGVESSDFARSKRQQKVITAIKQKGLSFTGLPRMFKLMEGLKDHFQTDLSINEIKDLTDYMEKLDLDNAKKISVADNNMLAAGQSEDGQWILLPTKGNWQEIQEYVYNVINDIENKNGSSSEKTK